MAIPLRLMDRDRLLPAGLEEKLRTRIQKLAHIFAGVKECRLTVDGPGQHPLKDRVRVRLYLSVPGTEIAVTHQGGEDAAVAIRSALAAGVRRLETHARHVRKLPVDVRGRPMRRAK